jgi:hypothetical protein
MIRSGFKHKSIQIRHCYLGHFVPDKNHSLKTWLADWLAAFTALADRLPPLLNGQSIGLWICQ